MLPLLKQQFPIDRARMRLKLAVPLDVRDALEAELRAKDAVVEGEEMAGGAASLIVQVEPGLFRDLHNFLQTQAHGAGRIEVMNLAVMAEGASADEFANMTSAMARATLASNTAAAAAAAQEAGPGPGSAAAGRVPGMSSPAALLKRGQQREAAAAPAASGGSGGDVVYARGPIADLPEAHASRKVRSKAVLALVHVDHTGTYTNTCTAIKVLLVPY